MQSSSEQPLVGRSLRDDPNNGCEGDYSSLRSYDQGTSAGRDYAGVLKS